MGDYLLVGVHSDGMMPTKNPDFVSSEALLFS